MYIQILLGPSPILPHFIVDGQDHIREKRVRDSDPISQRSRDGGEKFGSPLRTPRLALSKASIPEIGHTPPPSRTEQEVKSRA